MPVQSDVATDSTAEAVRRIRHRWQMVVMATVVVTLSAWALAGLQPKRYRAVCIAALMPNESLQTGDLLRTVDSLERRNIIATVAVLATTPLTHAQVLATMPPQSAPGDYVIDSRVMPNTNLFRIEVEGDDPVRAADLANRVPKVIAAQTLQMYKVYGVATVSAATPPTEPYSPRVGRSIAAGFVLGLLIGVMLAYFSERFGRRLRTAGF